MKTYRGRCHCGAVRWTLHSEEIVNGLRCNCSICVRKGVLLSTRYYTPAELTELTGAASLTRYTFGDRMVNHCFCPTCGICPFTELTALTDRQGQMRINLGCLEELDPLALPVEVVDGRSF